MSKSSELICSFKWFYSKTNMELFCVRRYTRGIPVSFTFPFNVLCQLQLSQMSAAVANPSAARQGLIHAIGRALIM